MSKITGSSLNRKMKQITDMLQSNGKSWIKKEQIFDSDQSMQQKQTEELPKQVKFQAEGAGMKKDNPPKAKVGSKKFKEDDQQYQLNSVDEEISTFSADQEEEEQSFSDVLQRSSRRNSSTKSRKVRTTITQQKLVQMNKIFKQFKEMRDAGITHKEINLKAICHQLQLGYSTILHKYREFRNNSEVKGGALLQSRELRRKYKKSVEIEEHIKEAMRERNLTNAVQISKYIYKTKKIYYSRAVICRHLGAMRNPKRPPKPMTEHQRAQELRVISEFQHRLLDCKHQGSTLAELFNAVVELWTRKNGKIAYFHEVVYEKQQESQGGGEGMQKVALSLYLVVFQNKIVLHRLKKGMFENEEYVAFLSCIGQWKNKTVVGKGELLVLTNPSQVHYEGGEGAVERYGVRMMVTPMQFANPLQQMLVELKERILEREKETRHKFLIENLLMSWRGSRTFRFAV